jgi:hypothetical protein
LCHLLQIRTGIGIVFAHTHTVQLRTVLAFL